MARYPGSPNPCLLAIPLNMLVKLLTSWAKVMVTLWSTSVGCGTAGEGGGLVPLSLSWSDTSRDFCAAVQHKLVETTNIYYKSLVGVVKLPHIICYPLLRGGIKHLGCFIPPPPPPIIVKGLVWLNFPLPTTWGGGGGIKYPRIFYPPPPPSIIVKVWLVKLPHTHYLFYPPNAFHKGN